MPTVTLAESAKLTQDQLIRGVIETIIDTNQIWSIFPFRGIAGNALAYNRELTLGATAFTGVGDTDGTIGPNASAGDNLAARQAAKDPATFDQVTSALTTILGDAEVNGLIQATRSDRVDQSAVQIASKAKSASRAYQNALINGDGTNFSFPGLLSLIPSGQQVDTGTNGSALSFSILDELIDLVLDKDGGVDYIMMSKRTRRSYLALLRALGGAGIGDTVNLPGGGSVPSYRGVPIFVNDFIPVNQTKGASAGTTTIFAGTLDEGAGDTGISGLTAEGDNAGLSVLDVGWHQDKDERIYRVRWYVGLALYSELGVASAPGITN